MSDPFIVDAGDTGRYNVWISTSQNPFHWYLAKRVEPYYARTIYKGYGNAQFKIKRANIFDGVDYSDESSFPIDEGLWIKITDRYPNQTVGETPDDTDGPSNIKWYGNITKVIRKQADSTNDYVGEIEACEIGTFLKKVPLTRYFDQYNRQIFSPPHFNPFDPNFGIFYGNYESTSGRYRQVGYTTSAVDYTGWGDSTKVWTRRTVLRYLLDCIEAVIPTITINIPTELAAHFDDLKPRSYESYYGKSIMDALEDMIPSPYNWSFDPTQSSGELDIIIVSETVDTLGNFGAQTPISTLNLSAAGLPVVEFHITRTEEKYDQVILEGERVLCCGSLSPAPFNNQQTISPGWLTVDREEFQTAAGVLATADENQVWRTHHPKYIHKFLWKTDQSWNTQGAVVVSDLPGDDDGGTATFKPLCPYFQFYDPTTEVVSAVVYTDIQSNPAHHSTPNQFAWEVAEFIPVREFSSDPDKTSKWKAPTLFYMTVDQSSGRLQWVDIAKPGEGIDSAQLDFAPRDGFLLNHPYPEVLGWDNDALFGGSPSYSHEFWDLASGLSSKNPSISGKGRGNWQRSVLTIAVWSDQKLRCVKTRRDGLGNKVTVNRIKTIVDKSLQNWYMHDATALEPLWDDVLGYQFLRRNTGAGWTRDDTDKANDIVSQSALWLFRDRQSANMTTHLNGAAQPSWMKLGTMIGQVQDGTNNYTFNTTINSITYRFDRQSPRLELSTSIPELPPLQMLAQPPKQAAPRMIGDSSGPSIVQRSYELTTPQQPKAGVRYAAPVQVIATGGVGSTIGYGEIYQGYNSPISGSGTSGDPYVYPVNLPFCTTLGATDTPSAAPDLSIYLLRTMEHGDPLAKPLPPGECLVRLISPTDLGNGIKYNADSTTFGSSADGVSGVTPVMVEAMSRNGNQIYTWWDRSVSLAVTGAAISGYWSVSSDNLSASSALSIDTVNTYGGTTAVNEITIKLNRTINEYETVIFTVNSGAVKNHYGDTNGSQTKAVSFNLARNCYCFAFNKSGKLLQQGDLVEILVDHTVNLTDAQTPSHTKTFYQIIPIDGQTLPLTRGFNDTASTLGGGMKVGTFPPITPQEFTALTQSGIIPGKQN